MNSKRTVLAAVAATALSSFAITAQQPPAAQAPPQPMRFFVTGTTIGQGANLGGLAGADAHCQKLADAAGSTGRTWRAYLSTQGPGAVNARDRIGAGPWHNAKGELIASNVADLHGDVQRDRNNITKASALTEKGELVKGRGDTPNQHDIITGSDSTGRAIAGTADMTCGNYTSSTAGAGSTMLGHSDRMGGGNTSWNAAHGSRGCSQENLIATGGNAYFYCFATN